MDKKIEVLLKVVDLFETNNIKWALGGSFLLYFKNILDKPSDIDIMVSEDDALKAKELLQGLGVCCDNKHSSLYKTKHFYEFKVNGVDIDLIGGMVIVYDNQYYRCPLNLESIEVIDFKDKKIPLDSVSKWYEYYFLMKRMDKVLLLSKHGY